MFIVDLIPIPAFKANFNSTSIKALRIDSSLYSLKGSKL